jgi:hypothetical protein
VQDFGIFPTDFIDQNLTLGTVSKSSDDVYKFPKMAYQTPIEQSLEHQLQIKSNMLTFKNSDGKRTVTDYFSRVNSDYLLGWSTSFDQLPGGFGRAKDLAFPQCCHCRHIEGVVKMAVGNKYISHLGQFLHRNTGAIWIPGYKWIKYYFVSCVTDA